MEKHFFCPSCRGVDTTPHECRTDGCDLKGQPLQECDCDDPDSHRKETTEDAHLPAQTGNITEKAKNNSVALDKL